MATVHLNPPPVQSSPTIAIVGLPETIVVGPKAGRYPMAHWERYCSLPLRDREAVRAARDLAYDEAIDDRGTDNCGLTSEEIAARVRTAEAEAIALAEAPATIPLDIEVCPSKLSRKNKWCYDLHPTDMAELCDVCLGGADPAGELPDWMGGTGDAGNPPQEPRLPMPDWIEVKASEIRLLDSNLAEWLAGKIDQLAAECRMLGAITPDEFEARYEAMTDAVNDYDAMREDALHRHGCPTCGS